ncbi:MAG: Rossmann fold domain-containing protein [Erythrobacter sp.]
MADAARQVVYIADDLPSSALAAAQEWFAHHHQDAHAKFVNDAADTLVILLPPAPYDHADWRRALARDAAREHTPRRINVIAAPDRAVAQPLLDYLLNAPGVTGQYFETHD